MPASRLRRLDPQRFASVLLYARGSTSFAYARTRRRDALVSADAGEAEFWSLVEEAMLSLLSCPDATTPN
jgi:hypothetical protein